MEWSNYHCLADINAWILTLPSKYPNVVFVESVGQSYENRSIYSVRIVLDQQKPTIIIDSGKLLKRQCNHFRKFE